jgi:uroporphyrinogen decarboxylase
VIAARELVGKTLAGEPVPRIPTGPLAVHYCARFAGASVRQYTSDARVLAESVIRYYERFRPDAVWLSSDTWVNAQAMGARVGAAADDLPWGGLGGPVVRTARDIDLIPKPDIGTQGRYPLMLEALRRVSDALGNDVFVVGCFDQYPFSLAAALLGVNEIMLKLTDDRPLVEALMERCLEFALAYGTAMAQAGAQLLSGGDSTAGLAGPRHFRELALPFERRLIAGLKAAAGKPVSLHICGRATPLLADMATAGADVLEIDQQVDMGAACDIVPPEITLWGNIDPVGVLLHGSPGDVEAACRGALTAVRARGRSRFVLSSGCTLALETPPENLDALLNTFRIPAPRQ